MKISLYKKQKKETEFKYITNINTYITNIRDLNNMSHFIFKSLIKKL
jgi:hypothetical protein